MKELINVQTISSRDIAEITGKPHNDTLKAIRIMESAWEKVTEGNFALSEYTDSTGRKLPMYELTKTESLYVATKFNDEARAKLILRWEELETKSRLDFSNPDTIIMLAQNWKEEQQKRIALEKENILMQPKADFVDRAVDIGHLSDVGQASKLLKLPYGRNIFFKNLRDKGIFFKSRNEPKQEYIDRGYFELRVKEIPRDNSPSFMVTKVLVTSKGLLWLSKQFNHNINPYPRLALL